RPRPWPPGYAKYSTPTAPDRDWRRTMAARQRKVYHASFDEKEEGWVLRAEGGRRVGGPYATKAEALADAKQGVKAVALGQIVVHGRDRKPQTEHAYGAGPRPHRG